MVDFPEMIWMPDAVEPEPPEIPEPKKPMHRHYDAEGGWVIDYHASAVVPAGDAPPDAEILPRDPAESAWIDGLMRARGHYAGPDADRRRRLDRIDDRLAELDRLCLRPLATILAASARGFGGPPEDEFILDALEREKETLREEQRKLSPKGA